MPTVSGRSSSSQPLEAYDARRLAGHQLVSAGVGLFAMFFAMFAPLQLAFLSPSSFALMGPAHAIYGSRSAKRRRAFIERTAAAADAQVV